MFQCHVYDFWGLVLRRAAGYSQKKLISLDHTPLCFTLFSILTSLFLSFHVPCLTDDLHSEITSTKERVVGINQGRREVGSGRGNVTALVLIK